MQALQTIREQPAFKELISLGGEIYLVGGVVRDSFMNIESKDIDLIVRMVPMKKILKTLGKFGKVEEVGESFAVLKFVPKGWTDEPIDVALPRTETKVGAGHKGFDVQSDYRMSIEEDLIRRDITINSIAVAMDGTVIDPFNGREDIKSMTIRATSPKSFSDDPLRMLRCVQFSARFGFIIENETFNMIDKHAALIKEIAGERIKGELDKIQTKGSLSLGANIMLATGLDKHIFGEQLTRTEYMPTGRHSQAEFYTFLLAQFNEPDKVLTDVLKGDTSTAKHVKMLTKLMREITTRCSENEIRVLAAEAVRGSSDKLLTLPLAKALLSSVVGDFDAGMPKRVTELAVGGEDLMERGLQGRMIGETMNRLLNRVLCKELPNERERLLAAI